ncbi:phage minor capsid protein [Lactiplantibacillus plantarum]|uniref:phage minor capsid protein n=1 Tax=Lactiplantibacillus plantarum TaxID=1590 RepID=UPI00293CE6C6|nr:phage minor capsid protein [Lactiplantibacillus plantarum]MDV3526121.1 phage minor capsid protein [Lactiplantibacillus plantarum]
MITQDSMMHDANAAVDIYSKLEQDIYARIIQTLKTTKFDTVDSQNVLRWQVEQLSKMGVLNKQVIDLVAKYTGESQQAITKLVHDNGFQVVNEIDATLSQQLHKKIAVDDEIRNTINSLQNQTWKELDNTVNQSLLSTNYNENGAMRAYQGIIKQTTMETVVGLKTHDRALKDSVYKWVDAGIKSNLVDKGGHNWSLEGYARTVINTTAHRTFNNLRLKRMQDYGTTLAVMSSHPASRKACAYIQGHVVNLTEPGSDTYNAKYDSIYNHGYGTPAGTQGINCSHELYPFIDGVNTNNQPQYDPQTAIAKGDIQAKQRGYERAIRQSKKKLAAAQKLGDDVGVSHYKSLISNQQKSLRELVNDHDFLHRDYSREQVYSSNITQPKPVTQEPNKTEFKSSVKDSDIINAFDKANIKEAFGDEYYKQFKSSISSLKDEQLRKLYANYGQDLEFANVTTAGGDYASTSTVHLSNSAFEGSKISEPMETVYHEIGHAIDSTSMNDVFGKQLIPTGRQIKQRLAGKTYKFDEQASHLSGNPAINLGNTIKQDLFDYINHGEAKSPMQMGKKPRKKAEKAIWMEEDSKSWEGVEKIRQFIRDTKPTALENMRKYSNVSDMIEGTGYDVFDHPWNTGHGSKYWKDYGKEETEFFAEYTSSRAANPASLALIKEIFPNAAKICDSLIDTMVEAKK